MSELIHLIIKYCRHALPERQREYDYCLRQNLANPFVACVYNLCDPSIEVPLEFQGHPKYRHQELHGSYMSFKDAFAFANTHLSSRIVCVANLDTFLSHSSDWNACESLLRQGIVLALSRTEFDGIHAPYKDPIFEKFYYANSQDAWLYAAPFMVPDCEFDLGTLGCDNALAERIKRAGRVPVNSPNRFQLLHFDQARGKHAGNQATIHARERIGKPNRKPEEKGQWLLPDIDKVQSLDHLADHLQLSPLERYQLACLMFSAKITVRNP